MLLQCSARHYSLAAKLLTGVLSGYNGMCRSPTTALARYGHYAADCPDPAPCFRCGQLGRALSHWAKDCPQLHADQLANTETRWIIFEPLTPKIYRHSCAMCGYETSLMTKASGGMPRHKCNGEWCNGSGLHPGCSELLEECNQNRKEYLRTLTCFHLDLDSKLTS